MYFQDGVIKDFNGSSCQECYTSESFVMLKIRYAKLTTKRKVELITFTDGRKSSQN